ncbi:MAG TPA: hypothetical protein EYP57_06245 [Thermodesulfobacteriaceae bacterium]|nr:hypothetical protein [Thermodesulfobacteriaceae bacterium]
MIVVCRDCGRQYKIAGERWDAGSSGGIKCLRCSGKLETQDATMKPEDREKGEQTVQDRYIPEFFEPGTKVALLYCPDPMAAQQVKKGLAELDYKVRPIAGKNDIISRFRYYHYSLVLLYQKSHEPDRTLKEIQEDIDSLDPEMRRNTFVLYVHMGGNQYDSMQAFSMGVDLAISPMELSRLTKILPASLEAKNLLYRRYHECRAKIEEDYR